MKVEDQTARPIDSRLSESGIGLRVIRNGVAQPFINNPEAEAAARARVEADNARFLAEQAAKAGN